MIDVICKSWGWKGLEPTEIVAINGFGNLIFTDATGRFWRICPEKLSCEIVAEDDATYSKLLCDEDYCADWEMASLVELGEQINGTLPEGRCYCLKLPATLGGKYEAKNIGTVSIAELIVFSGDVAHQIKDLPNGEKIEIKIID